MLTTERARRTCKKYSTRDANGKVHCYDCPLLISKEDKTCRAFMHWDRKKRKWLPDAL